MSQEDSDDVVVAPANKKIIKKKKQDEEDEVDIAPAKKKPLKKQSKGDVVEQTAVVAKKVVKKKKQDDEEEVDVAPAKKKPLKKQSKGDVVEPTAVVAKKEEVDVAPAKKKPLKKQSKDDMVEPAAIVAKEEEVDVAPAKKKPLKKQSKVDVVEPTAVVAKEEEVDVAPAKKKTLKKQSKGDVVEPTAVVAKIEDKKTAILDALEKMRKKELVQKQIWKAKAYDKVIKQVKSFDKPITSFEDIKELPGIGDKIEQKIKEIIETGTLHQLQDYNADGTIKATTELLKVHGIGPVKAKELVEKHGIKTIDDLKEKQELLNDVQKKGLLYYEDTDKRISRTEMEKHNTYILDAISSIDPLLRAELTGSFRRKSPDSGDIDVLITHKDDPEDFAEIFRKIVSALKSMDYIKDVFAEGSHKCLAICKLKRHKTFRRIDLLYTQQKEFPFALMYFTGSGDFNVDMRNLALSKGYSLSEHGMKHIDGENKGRFVDHPFHEENDIFEFLGMEFIPPEKRINYKPK